ncbi:MAG: alpha/beta hydrolase [Deltaproteobacteria bacterium]
MTELGYGTPCPAPNPAWDAGAERSSSDIVILVHGLWMTGLEMTLLARRLRADGYCPVKFRYSSLRLGLYEAAKGLASFALRFPHSGMLHFVGHSLGGLVILKLFEGHESALLPPGRIVLLGTPCTGCLAAKRLATIPFGSRILGPGIMELLSGKGPVWKGTRELGIVAGRMHVGLGRLLGIGGRPGDGTVLVEETELSGATDRITVPATHTGLVLSHRAAREISSFLRHGRFGNA